MAHIALGDKFGRLAIIGIAPSGRRWRRRFLCRCDCGIEKVVYGTNLVRGFTRSCGCLRLESSRVAQHGHTRARGRSKEFQAWVGMRQRCMNPNRSDFKRYGGRGIKVCARWRRSFKAFLADLGLAPSPQHSLDRINNDQDYRPGNVQWATDDHQRRNRRDRHLITYQGETLNLNDWARRCHLGPGTVHNRLRNGWPIERALTEPPHKR